MQQNAKELSASRALLHPLKIAVIRNSPASRQTAWCWASFMLRFGAFLRIKSPMCRSFFYAVLTYCALPITVTARSWSKNEHFSLYREKAREEKEGKHRLWERCVNRLRFSAVSIAAAREKREGGVFRSGGLPPLFFSSFTYSTKATNGSHFFSLNIRDYSASLFGVTGRKSSCTPSLRSKHMVFASATQNPRTL